jgi:hypothetical protein
VAVAGTLLGALVGALSTYFTQAASYQRESSERQRDLRRKVYLEWLRLTHQLFAAVDQVVREHPESSTEAVVSALNRIPAEPGQVALENVRLVANEDVAEWAANMWAHLRRELVPQGQRPSNATWAEAWRAWDVKYWSLRRAFVDAARTDFGLPPLDWRRAGVSSKYPPRSEGSHNGSLP